MTKRIKYLYCVSADIAPYFGYASCMLVLICTETLLRRFASLVVHDIHLKYIMTCLLFWWSWSRLDLLLKLLIQLHAMRNHWKVTGNMVYHIEYKSSCIVVGFVVVVSPCAVDSCDTFTHIRQGCFAGTEGNRMIVTVPVKWRNTTGLGEIDLLKTKYIKKT